MTTRAVSAQWQRAAASLIERAGKLTASSTDAYPERLYHFTDCAGLIGIFENKTLWASLATSLNDPSEVRYGLDLACELFRQGTITAQNFSLDGVDKLVAARAAESRAYIISFCANLSVAGQWLHYGRSGSGAAVGFYPEHLTQAPYDLFRIVYPLNAQTEVIRAIIRTIDDSLAELLPSIGEETQRDRLKAIAADLAADHLWMASPKLKHPSFAAEEEWRLIAYELRGPGAPVGEGPAGTTHFRASAGRVVPYKRLTFTMLPAFEVVLGSSCPMGPNDLGVLVLMEEKLGARLTIRVSDVPVRA
jgi:DUF2971 family protein